MYNYWLDHDNYCVCLIKHWMTVLFYTRQNTYMWNEELEFKWVSSLEIIQKNFVMDLFSLFLLTHENNEIKSQTKIYDFTVYDIYPGVFDTTSKSLIWWNTLISVLNVIKTSISFKESVSFFLGSMNRSAGQTNRVNRKAILGQFLCPTLRFIPHKPPKTKKTLIPYIYNVSNKDPS